MANEAAECKGPNCKQRIRWLEVEGKRIMVNARRVAIYLEAKDGSHHRSELGYLNHYLTCPDAAKF